MSNGNGIILPPGTAPPSTVLDPKAAALFQEEVMKLSLILSATIQRFDPHPDVVREAVFRYIAANELDAAFTAAGGLLLDQLTLERVVKKATDTLRDKMLEQYRMATKGLDADAPKQDV